MMKKDFNDLKDIADELIEWLEERGLTSTDAGRVMGMVLSSLIWHLDDAEIFSRILQSTVRDKLREAKRHDA